MQSGYRGRKLYHKKRALGKIWHISIERREPYYG